MYDKRVFRGNTHNANLLKQNLTPAQKEELRIKAEKEKKKVEMIKQQLVEFKNSKKKETPYDLRPLPPARIEVNLTEFLTEQNKFKPEEATVKCQTDEFVPRPATPPYVPKKTGINKGTEIGDYDLFDYDIEVQPILNVLLSKTVEQVCLEVEEETELAEIRKFKTEYRKRQEDLRADWEEEVKREIHRIKQKNKALKIARLKREQQVKTMHKLQCLNISKRFLQNCFMNTMSHLAENNFWRNSFKDQLEIAYKDHLYNKVLDEAMKHELAADYIEQQIDAKLESICDRKREIMQYKMQ